MALGFEGLQVTARVWALEPTVPSSECWATHAGFPLEFCSARPQEIFQGIGSSRNSSQNDADLITFIRAPGL